MKVKPLTLINIILATVLLTSMLFSVMTVNTSSSVGEYDPWIDYNDDGRIDHKDLFQLAAVYSTSGDPTKTVNVKNWPVSTAITVWYSERLYVHDVIQSGYYNASGFGHLHVLTHCAGLSGVGTVDLEVQGRIWKPDHTSYLHFTVYSLTLTPESYEHNVTIPVPCEEFSFRVKANALCDFWLSFYLTWA